MSVRDLIILGCSSQQPTRTRNHGAYLVRWNEEGLLFDPGEGTQRQFIFANVAPTCVTRIFISHFHGDHCLGLGSMLMRLNLDKVTHPIHCYYPASGKVYFDRLRFGCIYHENITVIEHPVREEGVVHEDEKFRIEAKFLEHGIENVGWRVQEKDFRKFDKEKLDA
ncbi:MAG: MBL fold metallo-hydrolase, partial [Chlamydiales bacterium]